MSPKVCNEIRQEVEFVRRFTRNYRQRIGSLINELNTSPAESAGMRLCVEAVDMLLTSQAVIAEALNHMSEDEQVAARPRAA